MGASSVLNEKVVGRVDQDSTAWKDGCNMGAILKCIKTKTPRKFMTCKALLNALQDGLEPTTP